MSDTPPHRAEQPEPLTPMWLPALGAALFVAVGIWWATTPAPAPPPVEVAVTTSAEAGTQPPPPVPAATAMAMPQAPQGLPRAHPAIDPAQIQRGLGQPPGNH